MISKILSLTLLAASASAAALPVEASSDQYSWQVNEFASTCTAATCRYTFRVSGPQGPSNQPPFDASGCVGTSVQGGFKACSTVGVDVPGNVEAQEYNFGSDIGAIISVRYTFEQNGIRYTYTGNQSVAHTNGDPAIEFQITPLEVFAVPVEA